MSRFDPALFERALQAIGKPAPALVWGETETEALDLAAALCRRFEGFFSAPYLCPARVATIGYGATYYFDGRPVTLADAPISREAAERLLVQLLRRKYLPSVLQLCPVLREAAPGRVAALLDFTFNLGAGRLQASALRRAVNEGDWERVPLELRKWVIGGGRPLRGLVLRREAEIALL